MRDSDRELQQAWRRAHVRRTSWFDRWVREDLLGTQIKAVIFLITGGFFAILGFVSGPAWIAAFGLALVVVSIALLKLWRRDRRKREGH